MTILDSTYFWAILYIMKILSNTRLLTTSLHKHYMVAKNRISVLFDCSSDWRMNENLYKVAKYNNNSNGTVKTKQKKTKKNNDNTMSMSV